MRYFNFLCFSHYYSNPLIRNLNNRLPFKLDTNRSLMSALEVKHQLDKSIHNSCKLTSVSWETSCSASSWVGDHFTSAFHPRKLNSLVWISQITVGTIVIYTIRQFANPFHHFSVLSLFFLSSLNPH